ncbi:hypothetical protein CGMCC3_g6406 [Colletotrichum fructicola]|nr:uncharacterized protein CGMCC3_g6406 [Colletotrichum fructicola]KAE9577361.1 hypothetical protein CGMCC3_g6406 [Colletotrichum fructicola]KAF4411641.1 GTP-binding protein rhb1 [Colletotrichum fructicola]
MVPATAGGIYRLHTPLTSATPSRYRLIPHQSAPLNLNWCIARLPQIRTRSRAEIRSFEYQINASAKEQEGGHCWQSVRRQIFACRSDEYSILNSKHFIGIHGYMLVYSVSSLPSFEMVQVIREKILNHLGTESVPIVIVGNKSDLRPEQRQVSAEEGKKLSERIQCGWTEASARYNENVSKAFEILIAQIEKAQNPNEAAEGGKCTLM